METIQWLLENSDNPLAILVIAGLIGFGAYKLMRAHTRSINVRIDAVTMEVKEEMLELTSLVKSIAEDVKALVKVSAEHGIKISYMEDDIKKVTDKVFK